MKVKASHVICGLRRAQQRRFDHHAAVVAAEIGLLDRRESRADLRQV